MRTPLRALIQASPPSSVPSGAPLRRRLAPLPADRPRPAVPAAPGRDRRPRPTQVWAAGPPGANSFCWISSRKSSGAD